MRILGLPGHSIAPVAYGFAFTLGSSVGQTFFISLFVPALLAATGASSGELAALYSAATLLSALALPLLGRLIDRIDIARYGLLAGAGTLAGCLLVAAATDPLVAFVALFLLRLFGQGLLPHVGVTGAARYLTAQRGRALSLIGLGYSAGEGLLPLIATAMIAIVGWRTTYAGAGVAVGAVLIPLATLLILKDAAFRRAEPELPGKADEATERSLLRSAAFWCYLPSLALPSLAMTALLFVQGIIAASKGLSLQEFAAGFVGYALVQIPASLLVGAAVDRYGSRIALLLHLLPLAVGAAMLASSKQLYAAWTYLALAGATAAASSILRTSFVAELVPVSRLGAARSLVGSILVMAAAAGPALYGGLLETGVGVDGLLWLTVAATGAAMLPPLALAMTTMRSAKRDIR
jgi:MFS family permease